MQNSRSSANVEEQFGNAMEEVHNLLDEHERWCAEQVAAAEEAAQSDIARFKEASQELARERRKLADLEKERENLPFEAFRANMDGDAKLESELRTRYEEIRLEDLERLRGRCLALVEEVNSLGGTQLLADKRAHRNALDVYDSARQSMQLVEGQIVRLKEAAEAKRTKLWSGRREVEEHLDSLRLTERAERHEAQRQAAGRRS